jgi:hypothetical protein
MPCAVDLLPSKAEELLRDYLPIKRQLNIVSHHGCFWGIWVAAVDALEAAHRITAGTVEGGFILRSECIPRSRNKI